MAEVSSVRNTKLIACVLPKGRAMPLQQALVDEKGIQCGNFHFGRGIGRDSHIRERGIGEQQEREIFDLPVLDEGGHLQGLIHLHPALRALLGE